MRGVAVGVNTNAAEVVTEAGFHEAAWGRIQRLARRLECVVDDCRRWFVVESICCGGGWCTRELFLGLFLAGDAFSLQLVGGALRLDGGNGWRPHHLSCKLVRLTFERVIDAADFEFRLQQRGGAVCWTGLVRGKNRGL